MGPRQNGRRWTVQIVRCGGCGKPRGITHTCIEPAGRRVRRHRFKPQVRVRCGTCGQCRSPLAFHVCMVRTDFGKRRRHAEASRRRAREQAARRLRREREAAARQVRRQREAEARRRRREREAGQRRERRERDRDRERQRRRNAADSRRGTPRSQRNREAAPGNGPPRGRRPDMHPYDQCRDDDCQRRACIAYRQGVEDCPLPHGGD